MKRRRKKGREGDYVGCGNFERGNIIVVWESWVFIRRDLVGREGGDFDVCLFI